MRNNVGRMNLTPGPGAYAAKAIIGGGPSKSMGSMLKFSIKDKEDFGKPGPGSYSHNKLNVLTKSHEWKIGSEPRRDKSLDAR